MIRIPEVKYSNSIEKEHYNNIKLYLENVIKFYINCCKIYKEDMDIEKYKDGVTLHGNTLRLLINTIFKPVDKNNESKITDILRSRKVVDFFENNYDNLEKLLTEFIEVGSDIHIEKIITMKPQELEDIYSKIKVKYRDIKDDGKVVFENKSVKSKVLSSIINNIFDYDKFTRGDMNYINSWSAYKLCEKLNVNVCPYCNRLYTVTVINKDEDENITRPELDHYIPRSENPLFALSFFNLIPSCKICNSTLKGKKYLSIEEYLHPYLDGVDDKLIFNYIPSGTGAYNSKKDEIKLSIDDNNNNKIKNSLKLFKIEDIYKHHNDIVSNLIYKSQIYNEINIENIVSMFEKNHKETLTKEDIYKIIFYDCEEIIDESLGKLKRDILSRLNIIK